jgi:hypothetical protein
MHTAVVLSQKIGVWFGLARPHDERKIEMSLFRPKNSQTTPETIHQIKRWVYDTLQLDHDIPISISQLRCSEPGCPPIETVISVMHQPPETYKIHKSAADIEQSDILNLFRSDA